VWSQLLQKLACFLLAYIRPHHSSSTWKNVARLCFLGIFTCFRIFNDLWTWRKAWRKAEVKAWRLNIRSLSASNCLLEGLPLWSTHRTLSLYCNSLTATYPYLDTISESLSLTK
jgi:hypothetical protein